MSFESLVGSFVLERFYGLVISTLISPQIGDILFKLMIKQHGDYHLLDEPSNCGNVTLYQLNKVTLKPPYLCVFSDLIQYVIFMVSGIPVAVVSRTKSNNTVSV